MKIRRYILYIVKRKDLEEYSFFTPSKDTALAHIKRYPQKNMAVYRVICKELEIEEVST